MEAFKQFSSCKAATKLFESAVFNAQDAVMSRTNPQKPSLNTNKKYHVCYLFSHFDIKFMNMNWRVSFLNESEAQKSSSGMSSLFLLLLILKSFVYLDIVA